MQFITKGLGAEGSVAGKVLFGLSINPAVPVIPPPPLEDFIHNERNLWARIELLMGRIVQLLTDQA